MFETIGESKAIANTVPDVREKPLVVVGIPAYNEEATIARVVLEAQQFADVVLVCDDGSNDMTGEIASRLGADVITHERNLGYGAATKSLLTMARQVDADVLVTLDGDGQHLSQDIPKLLEPILENKADIVLGSRFLVDTDDDKQIPRYRRWGIKTITKLTGAAANHKLNDAQCGFRVYGRKAISELRLAENGMGASVELLLKAKKQGLTVTEISTQCMYKNLEKTSTKNPLTHAGGVLMSLLRFVIEERPLMALGIPSLIFLFAGAGFGIWMLQIYAIEHRIVTNIALASIGFILIGMFTLFTSITLYAISRHTQKNGE